MLKPSIFLDFDGVLFESSREAYEVCIQVANDYPEDYPNIPSFDSFLQFRGLVSDAWQYRRLLSDCIIHTTFDKPNKDDLEFSRRFFQAREKIMNDKSWGSLFTPTNFFQEIEHLLVNSSQSFYIVSTRNYDSIAEVLKNNHIELDCISGQEDLRLYGTKVQSIVKQGWLDKSKFSMYVDDSTDHIDPFIGVVDLAIHADWGYGESTKKSLDESQVAKIIKLLFGE